MKFADIRAHVQGLLNAGVAAHSIVISYMGKGRMLVSVLGHPALGQSWQAAESDQLVDWQCALFADEIAGQLQKRVVPNLQRLAA